ncbi:MAG: DUF2252 family protein [Cyclobacteriaceae bacterium]
MNTIKSIRKDFFEMKDLFLESDRGYFLFFRKMAMNMQEMFTDMVDHKKIPLVFIHGNPHIENYTITKNGAGLVDFDRSRIGSYSWDIVRFLSSLSLKKEGKSKEFLSPIVTEYFKEGYLRGLNSPNMEFKGISQTLEKIEYKVWHKSITDYLDSNTKWVKKMRKNSVSTDDKDLNQLVKRYLKSREDSSKFKDYKIEEAGKAVGTFGNRRYLVVISYNEKGKNIKNFIEVKTVYTDKDSKYYYNPYKHHGIRMIKASKIYAKGLELGLGYTTYQGTEYWGREIPYMNAKVKQNLSLHEQIDIAYSVGTQLAKGHVTTLQKGVKVSELQSHFLKNYTKFGKISKKLNLELEEIYLDCKKRVNE